MFDLSDEIAIVTGGARGIGAATHQRIQPQRCQRPLVAGLGRAVTGEAVVEAAGAGHG